MGPQRVHSGGRFIRNTRPSLSSRAPRPQPLPRQLHVCLPCRCVTFADFGRSVRFIAPPLARLLRPGPSLFARRPRSLDVSRSRCSRHLSQRWPTSAWRRWVSAMRVTPSIVRCSSKMHAKRGLTSFFRQMNGDGGGGAEMKELAARICRDYLHGAWKLVNSRNIGLKHIRWGFRGRPGAEARKVQRCMCNGDARQCVSRLKNLK